jgi:hypothetical protein
MKLTIEMTREEAINSFEVCRDCTYFAPCFAVFYNRVHNASVCHHEHRKGTDRLVTNKKKKCSYHKSLVNGIDMLLQEMSHGNS